MDEPTSSECSNPPGLSRPLGEILSPITIESSSITGPDNSRNDSNMSPGSTGADTCSICLDVLQNLAVCDPCFHSFCYPCINAWSRVNNICPLCKTTFDKIHYDIKSNHEFKIQNVPPVNRLVGDDIPSVIAASTYSTYRPPQGDIHVPFMSPSWFFGRRRTTQHPLFSHGDSAGPSSSAFITSSLEDPHTGSVRITTHRGLNPNISISVGSFSNGPTVLGSTPNMVMPMDSGSSTDNSIIGRSSTISQSIYDAINSVSAGSSAAVAPDQSQINVPDMFRGIPRSDRRRMALQGRKLIYHHGFKVRHYNSNLSRDISLSFMQQRQASITRIMQWASRELSVLVDKRELSSTLASLNRLLRTVEIDSRQFYTGLVGKLGSRTHHFIHELKSFARSPFAMDEYDKHAVYGPFWSEKIATEITNEDIERWSLEDVQFVGASGSSNLPSGSDMGNSFAPATSSATCALLSSTPVPPLIILSDDDDQARASNASCSPSLVPSTSRSASHSNSSRRSQINRYRRNQMKSSSSTYSARVISSDEEIEVDFADRIKSVAIDESHRRDRSPVRSSVGKSKSRSRSRALNVGSSRDQRRSHVGEGEVSPQSRDEFSGSLKVEPSNEHASHQSSVLTLDSSIQQVQVPEETEDKPSMSRVPLFVNGAEIKMDSEQSTSLLGSVEDSAVKVEDGFTQGATVAKAEAMDSSVSVSVKGESTKTEPPVLSLSTTTPCPSQGRESALDLSVTAEETSGSITIDGQIELSSNSMSANSTAPSADDVLALTDDLRPKAIVPDMSDPAAAEVNVATSECPAIVVSESEEDAIVFLRQNVFTPPLVDLESETETRNLTPTREENVEVTVDGNEYESLDEPTPPKFSRRYSSTSSDEAAKARRVHLSKFRRRLKRKRRHFEQAKRAEKRSNATNVDTDQSISSPKKFRETTTNDDVFANHSNAIPAADPPVFGNFFGESTGLGTSNENSLDTALDLRNNESLPGSSAMMTHPLSGILGYKAADGYSSDSEGVQNDTFSPSARYHPYI